MEARKLNSLDEAFAYFTECQLATVERMEMVKSTSKSDLSRHRAIADSMVEHCRRLSVKLPASSFSPPQTPRLRKLLAN